MKLEWLRNISAGPKESRFNLQTEKTQNRSKLETYICRLTIFNLILFLRVGCHGDFKINENNDEKLNHISILDHISFDTDICSCGLESI